VGFEADDRPMSWVENVYRECRLTDGWSSELVLGKLLEVVGPSRGLPEMQAAYDRRPFDSVTMILDAWGVQSDESLGFVEGLPASTLHLVGFIDAEATRDDQFSLERAGDAMRGMIAFYERSARSVTPLHTLTGPNDNAWQPSKYIHDGQKTIRHVQFTLITTLNGEQERLQRITEVVLANASLTVSASAELWTRGKLESLVNLEESGDQVILDLSEQDEDAAELNPAPHPVIESGIEGGWEVYSTTFTGHQIARFYSRYRLKLLNENVRAFLQFTTKTNKAILGTIKNSPEKFVSFNNGISIVARSAEKNYFAASCDQLCCAGRRIDISQAEQHSKDLIVDGLWTLTDAQIVNGGQTTAAIYHASLDPEVRRSKALSRVRVSVKISVVPGSEDDRDDAIAQIAKYSNTQNAIKPADLESNNMYFRKLQEAAELQEVPFGLLSGTVWHFERTRGRYAESVALENPNWKRIHPQTQVITKYLLADVMNCLSGRPHESQLGGDALFIRYLRWLRASATQSMRKGALSESIFFASKDELNEAARLGAEWRGIVGAVIVRRELEQIFKDTDGWMRTISVRYVLALAYLAFAEEWNAVWEYQTHERLIAGAESGPYANVNGSQSFSSWARNVGKIVNEGIDASRVMVDGEPRDLNYTAKLPGTWEKVRGLAQEKGFIPGSTTQP
jgi:hypothetical protein